MPNLRFHRPIHLFGILAATTIFVITVGCGGSGGASNATGGTGSASPYAGKYSGVFIDQSNTVDTVTVTVANDGTFSGAYNYPTPISFNGSINSAGAGSLTDSQGTFPLQMGSAGKVVLSGGAGTSTNGAFVTMVTNPTGVFSGFSGQYAGTVHNTTLGKTGIIALNISASGVVNGVDLFDVNGTPTLVVAAGTLNSNGLLSYTVNGVTVSGTVALNGTTISGNLSESNGNSAVITLNQVQPF